MNRDFERLKTLLNLPNNVTLPSDVVDGHRNPDGPSDALSQDAIRAVKEWYRDDYDFIELCEKAKLLSPLENR